jgi:hypothetical protein
VRFITAHGLFPLRASGDLPQILTALAVEGARARIAPPARARHLPRFDRRCARRHPPRARSFPLLDAAAAAAASFKGETAQVREKIDASGEVFDHASPELRAIRDRLRKQKARLRSTLESYLPRQGDGEVSAGSGRHRAQRSIRTRRQSGASRRHPRHRHGTVDRAARACYLEPLSTVEINNDIVALEEQEAEEVRRILLGADRLRSAAARRPAADGRRPAIELDVLQGRARFSESIDGVEPGRWRQTAPSSCRPLATAAQEPGAGDDQGDPAGDDPARDRTEHRRQDRRAEDRGLLAMMMPGGLAHSPPSTDRGSRCFARCSPTSATSSRSRPKPEHVLGAHHQHRVDGPRAGRRRRSSARRSRLGHRSDRRRRARRRRSSITSAAAAPR